MVMFTRAPKLGSDGALVLSTLPASALPAQADRTIPTARAEKTMVRRMKSLQKQAMAGRPSQGYYTTGPFANLSARSGPLPFRLPGCKPPRGQARTSLPSVPLQPTVLLVVNETPESAERP